MSVFMDYSRGRSTGMESQSIRFEPSSGANESAACWMAVSGYTAAPEPSQERASEGSSFLICGDFQSCGSFR